jgi:hypothetical protein
MPFSTESFLDAVGKIRTGPILIGEDHGVAVARDAILLLMRFDLVTALSLEAPMGPAAMTSGEGTLRFDWIGRYFAGANIENHAGIPTYEMIAYMAQLRPRPVPVYCHDKPQVNTGLAHADGFREPQDEDLRERSGKPLNDRVRTSVYLYESRKIVNQTTPGAISTFALSIRNRFAAKYLQAKVGQGVKCYQGFVILAGSAHLKGFMCEDDTIQSLLGIGEERVFFWDSGSIDVLAASFPK